MKITWKDLTIDFKHLDKTRIIGTDKSPILISSIGDLFLKDNNDNYYWLNVGGGTLEKISDSVVDFKEKLKNDELTDEWFLIGLVAKLKENGLELRDNHLYSYKVSPALGGEYIPENFELTDIEVHFELNGQIHKQIKDLPDGTKVNLSIS